MRKFKLIKIYIIGFIVLYVGFALVFFINITKTNTINIDTDIPNIKLYNQTGNKKSLYDFKGRYVLVDFWFAGCKPCIEEMQYFPKLLEKYKPNLSIVSISIDSKEVTQKLLETKKPPFDFLTGNNDNWTFLNDPMIKDSSYVKNLGITNYPSYLFFDTEAKLIGTPISGIARVENKLGGLLDKSLTIKSKKNHLLKLTRLIIPYSAVFLIIILIILNVKRR